MGRGDGEAMTGHIGERGEETHGHSVICIGVKMDAGAGASGDMPHLSKLSEPRQRGAIISVTLILSVLTCFLCIMGLRW